MALPQNVLNWFYEMQITLKSDFEIDTRNKLDIGKIHFVNAYVGKDADNEKTDVAKKVVKREPIPLDTAIPNDVFYEPEYAFVLRKEDYTGYQNENFDIVNDQITFYVEVGQDGSYKMNSEMSDDQLMRIYNEAQYGRIYVDSWNTNLFAVNKNDSKFLLVGTDKKSLVLRKPEMKVLESMKAEQLTAFLGQHPEKKDIIVDNLTDQDMHEMSKFLVDENGISNSEVASTNMDDYTFRSLGQMLLNNELWYHILYDNIGWKILKNGGDISVSAFNSLMALDKYNSKISILDTLGVEYLYTVVDGKMQPLFDVNDEEYEAVEDLDTLQALSVTINRLSKAASEGGLYVLNNGYLKDGFRFTKLNKEINGEITTMVMSDTDMLQLNGDWINVVDENLKKFRNYGDEADKRSEEEANAKARKRLETGTDIINDEAFRKKLAGKILAGVRKRTTVGRYLSLINTKPEDLIEEPVFKEFLETDKFKAALEYYVKWGALNENELSVDYLKFESRLALNNRKLVTENYSRAILQLKNNITTVFAQNKDLGEDLTDICDEVTDKLKLYSEGGKVANNYEELKNILSPLSFSGVKGELSVLQRQVLADGKKIISMGEKNSLGNEDIIQAAQARSINMPLPVKNYRPDSEEFKNIGIYGDITGGKSFNYYKNGMIEGSIDFSDVNSLFRKKSAVAAVAEMLDMQDQCAAFGKIKVMSDGNRMEALYTGSDGGYVLENNPGVKEKYSSDVFSPLKGAEALKSLSNISVMNYLISGDSSIDWSTLSITENSMGDVVKASFYENSFEKAFESDMEVVGAMPPIIGKETADRLLAIDEFDFKYFLEKQGVSEKAVNAAWSRVEELSERIEADQEFFKEKPSGYAEPGHIRVFSENDWENTDFDAIADKSAEAGKKNLFTSIREVPGISAAVQQNNELSYMATEIKPEEIFGAEMWLGERAGFIHDFSQDNQKLSEIEQALTECVNAIRAARELEGLEKSKAYNDIAYGLSEVSMIVAGLPKETVDSNLRDIMSKIGSKTNALAVSYVNESLRLAREADAVAAAGQNAENIQAGNIQAENIVNEENQNENASFLNKEWDYEQKRNAFEAEKLAQKENNKAPEKDAAGAKAPAGQEEVGAKAPAGQEEVGLKAMSQKEIEEKLAGMTEEQQKRYRFIQDNNRIIIKKYPQNAMSEEQMINMVLDPDIEAKKNSFGDIVRREAKREEIYNNLQKSFPKQVPGFERVIPYFINTEGTPEAEKENRNLVASNQTAEGQALLFEKCVKELGNLTLKDTLLTSEEDIVQWSIRNRRVTELGFVTEDIKLAGKHMKVSPALTDFLERTRTHLESMGAYHDTINSIGSEYYGALPRNLSGLDLITLIEDFYGEGKKRKQAGYNIELKNNVSDESFTTVTNAKSKLDMIIDENKKLRKVIPENILNMKLSELIAVDENQQEVSFKTVLGDIVKNGKASKMKLVQMPVNRRNELQNLMNYGPYREKYGDVDFVEQCEQYDRILSTFNNSFAKCMNNVGLSLSSKANAELLKVYVPVDDKTYSEVPIMQKESVESYISRGTEHDRKFKSARDEDGLKKGIGSIVTMSSSETKMQNSAFSINKNFEIYNYVKAGRLFVCEPGEPFENARQLYMRDDGSVALSKPVYDTNRYSDVSEETRRTLEGAIIKTKADIAHKTPNHDLAAEKQVLDIIRGQEVRRFDNETQKNERLMLVRSIIDALECGQSREQIRAEIEKRKRDIPTPQELEELGRLVGHDVRTSAEVRENRENLRKKAVELLTNIEIDRLESLNMNRDLPGVRKLNDNRFFRAFLFDHSAGKRAHNEAICTKFYMGTKADKAEVINGVMHDLLSFDFSKYSRFLSDEELVDNYAGIKDVSDKFMEAISVFKELSAEGVPFDRDMAERVVKKYNEIGFYTNIHNSQMSCIVENGYPYIDATKLTEKALEEIEADDLAGNLNGVINYLGSIRDLNSTGYGFFRSNQIKRIIDPVKDEKERRFSKKVYIFDEDGTGSANPLDKMIDPEPGKVTYLVEEKSEKVYAFRFKADKLTIEDVTAENRDNCENFERLYAVSPELLEAKKKVGELYERLDNVDSFFIKSSPEFSSIKDELNSFSKQAGVPSVEGIEQTMKRIHDLSSDYISKKEKDASSGIEVNKSRLAAVREAFFYSARALYQISSAAERKEEVRVDEVKAEENNPFAFLDDSESVIGFRPTKPGAVNPDVDRINDVLGLVTKDFKLKGISAEKLAERKEIVEIYKRNSDGYNVFPVDLPKDANTRYGHEFIMDLSVKPGTNEQTDAAREFNEKVSAAFNNPKAHVKELKEWHEELYRKMLAVDLHEYMDNVDNDRYCAENCLRICRDESLLTQCENMENFLRHNGIEIDPQLRHDANEIARHRACLQVMRAKIQMFDNPYYLMADENSASPMHDMPREKMRDLDNRLLQKYGEQADLDKLENFVIQQNSIEIAKAEMKKQLLRRMFTAEGQDLIPKDKVRVFCLDEPDRVYMLKEVDEKNINRAMLVFTDETIPGSYMIPEGDYSVLFKRFGDIRDKDAFNYVKNGLEGSNLFNEAGQRPREYTMDMMKEDYGDLYNTMNAADSHFVVSSDEFAEIKKELKTIANSRSNISLKQNEMLDSTKKLLANAEAYIENKKGKNLSAFESRRLDAVKLVQQKALEIREQLRYARAFENAEKYNARALNKSILDNRRNRLGREGSEEKLIAVFGADAELLGGAASKKELAERMMSGQLTDADGELIGKAYKVFDSKQDAKEVYAICKNAMDYARKICDQPDGESIMSEKNAVRSATIKKICGYSKSMSDLTLESYKPDSLISEMIVSYAADRALEAEEKLKAGMKQETEEEKKEYREALEDLMYASALDTIFLSRKQGGAEGLQIIGKLCKVMMSEPKIGYVHTEKPEVDFANVFKNIIRRDENFKRFTEMPADKFAKLISENKVVFRSESVRMYAKVTDTLRTISLKAKQTEAEVAVKAAENQNKAVKQEEKKLKDNPNLLK